MTALTGCEVVAGIKDFTLVDGDGGGAEAAPGSGDDDANPTDATTLDGADAPAAFDATGRETGDTASREGGESGSASEGSAPGDGGGSDGADGSDAVAIAEGGDAGTGTHGEVGPETSTPGEAGASDGPPTVIDDSGVLLPDGAPAVTEVIDTMEARTGGTALLNGRDGFWFVYDDGTDGGTLTPPVGGLPAAIIAAIVPPRGSSMYAAHVQGSGFASYAGMGFDMLDMNSQKQPYNATAYQGFVFWGRSSTAPLTVRFTVPDANTNSAGGICTVCGDDFGINLTFTAQWQQFVVYYSQLAQLGFGRPNGSVEGGPTGVDAAQIYGCQFQVSPPASAGAFDVWIDDIDFIRN